MCVLLSPSGDCYLAGYSGDLVLANFANTRLPILSYHYPQYADLRTCEYSDIIQSNSDTIQSSFNKHFKKHKKSYWQFSASLDAHHTVYNILWSDFWRMPLVHQSRLTVLVDCLLYSGYLQMVTYYEPLTKVYLLCVDLQ